MCPVIKVIKWTLKARLSVNVKLLGFKKINLKTYVLRLILLPFEKADVKPNLELKII